MTKNLYCIVGPSGSGKSTLAAGLAKHGYQEVKSHTTRPCRGGDDINAYHFVSESYFMGMLARKEILEHTKYAGNYYGTAYADLWGKDFIIVELDGVRNLKERYPERPIKVIGLNADSIELQDRLTIRDGASSSRLDIDKQHFRNLSAYCDCHISGRSITDTLEIALGFIRSCEEGA